MKPRSDIDIKLNHAALLGTGISLALCITVLSGWIFDRMSLTQFIPGCIPMSFISAALFFLINAGLLTYLCSEKFPQFRRTGIAFVSVALTVSACLVIPRSSDGQTTLELWFNHLFLTSPDDRYSHITPVTLFSLLLSGTAVLLLLTSTPKNHFSKNTALRLTAVTALISYIILMEYIYNGVPAGDIRIAGTALPTAIILFIFSISLPCSLGESYQPVRSFLGSSVYAQMMRSFIPIVIFLIILQGWIHSVIFPQQQNYPYVTAVITVVSTLVLTLIIYKMGLTISVKIDEANALCSNALKQLGDSLFYNRSLIEASIDPMVTISVTGRITDANHAAGQFFGIPAEKLTGSDFSDYFTDPETAGNGFLTALETGLIRDYPLAFRKASGEIQDVLCNAVLYKNAGGQPVGIFATVKDITEHKKTQTILAQYAEGLEKTNRELRQFSYIATHDLQEPLRMISSFLQLLQRRYKGRLDKDADDFIEFSVNGALRLQHMINDLMIYSRLEERGKAFALTDFNSALNDVLRELQPEIDRNNAVITCDPLPTLPADRSQIMTVFQSLLSNAIKFHCQGVAPLIHVTASKNDNTWLFSVTDNGIGVPEEYCSDIFVVFKRLVGKEFPGTGIGLALCKKILERHHGQIWVESKRGKGSVFYFTLPGI